MFIYILSKTEQGNGENEVGEGKCKRRSEIKLSEELMRGNRHFDKVIKQLFKIWKQ